MKELQSLEQLAGAGASKTPLADMVASAGGDHLTILALAGGLAVVCAVVVGLAMAIDRVTIGS